MSLKVMKNTKYIQFCKYLIGKKYTYQIKSYKSTEDKVCTIKNAIFTIGLQSKHIFLIICTDPERHVSTALNDYFCTIAKNYFEINIGAVTFIPKKDFQRFIKTQTQFKIISIEE